MGDTHGHHGHEHGHHHHDHDHGSEAAEGDREKLKILINHWISHNTEHAQSLEEWIDKAGKMGLGQVAELLKDSSVLMRRSVDALEKAAGEFGSS